MKAFVGKGTKRGRRKGKGSSEAALFHHGLACEEKVWLKGFTRPYRFVYPWHLGHSASCLWWGGRSQGHPDTLLDGIAIFGPVRGKEENKAPITLRGGEKQK